MSTIDDYGIDTEAYRKRWGPRWRRLKRMWAQFTEHKMGIIGISLMIMFISWALFPELWTRHTPEWGAYQGYENQRLTPEQLDSIPHEPAFGDPFWAPLGTNSDGQSVWALLVYSADTALFIGLAAASLSSLVGVPLGLISGYYGDSWIDEAIQRTVDVMYGLPFLPFLIVLVAIRGVSTTNIILGIAITSWLNQCSVIRGEALSLKERSYVDSAKVAGASDARIVFRHILPNVLPLTFVYLATDAAGAILAEAALAYLGLADFTTVSWGMMIQNIQAKGYIFGAPWWLIPPGLAIAGIAVAFYFIGYSMEDVTNPQGT
jgi:peptide/nickel transport system permease protein